MAGDTAPTAAEAQAEWDAVNKEREAGLPPSDVAEDTANTTTAEATNEQTPNAEPTAEAAPEDDPYAGLSPALKARLERLETLETQTAQIPQLFQHVKTAEGRVAAIQRELDSAKAAAKATSTGPSQAQIQAAAGSTEKWDSLRTDFPEWAEATEQFVKASLAGLNAKATEGLTPAQVEAMVGDRIASERAATVRAIEEAKVEGKHEDWRQVINTPQFVDWYSKQPADLKALGASENGRDAIRLLDTYRASTAAPAAQVQESRQAKLAAAVNTRPGATTPAAKTIDQMTPAELWEHERKRAAKQGNGRVY